MKIKKKRKIIAAIMSSIIAISAFGTTASAQDTHIICCNSSSGPGEVSISHYQAAVGEKVTITATAIGGFVVNRFTLAYSGQKIIDDAPNINSKTYTFDMPDTEVYYVVAFGVREPTPTTPTEPETPTIPTMPTTPTVPTTPTEPETPTAPITPQYKKGDVNGDGRVNAADATLILKHSVQLITLTDEQLDRADVNDDRKVSAADATMILKTVVGLI